MPIYENLRLAHVHIPRTGGTAISHLLHRLNGGDHGSVRLAGSRHQGNRWFETHHATWGEMCTLTEDRYDTHPVFAVVRNPYQRLISAYRWRRNARPDSFIQAFATFDTFIAALPTDLDEAWDDHIVTADRGWANYLIHVRPQHHYLRNSDGELDPTFGIVRFEYLPHSIEAQLGALALSDGALREASSHPIAKYFSLETLAIVNRLYERDFRLLSYPMSERLPA